MTFTRAVAEVFDLFVQPVNWILLAPPNGTWNWWTARRAWNSARF